MYKPGWKQNGHLVCRVILSYRTFIPVSITKFLEPVPFQNLILNKALQKFPAILYCSLYNICFHTELVLTKMYYVDPPKPNNFYYMLKWILWRLYLTTLFRYTCNNQIFLPVRLIDYKIYDYSIQEQKASAIYQIKWVVIDVRISSRTTTERTFFSFV